MNQFPPPPSSFPPAPGAGQFGAPAPAGDGGDKKGKKKPASKRLINSQRSAAMVFAIIAALLVLLVNYGAKTPPTYVAVAPQGINALVGVSTANVSAVALPKDAVVDGAITGTSKADAIKKAIDTIGKETATQTIQAGTELTPSLFSLGIQLAQPLQPTERLVSIRANVGASVAGTLKAGDTVDIIAVATSADMANVIATNVPIIQATLSEDQLNSIAQSQASSPTSKPATTLLPTQPIPGTYVVRVQADQAELLSLADATTKLYLVLRGSKGSKDGQDLPLTVQDLMCNNYSLGQGQVQPAGINNSFCKSINGG